MNADLLTTEWRLERDERLPAVVGLVDLRLAYRAVAMRRGWMT